MTANTPPWVRYWTYLEISGVVVATLALMGAILLGTLTVAQHLMDYAFGWDLTIWETFGLMLAEGTVLFAVIIISKRANYHRKREGNDA